MTIKTKTYIVEISNVEVEITAKDLKENLDSALNYSIGDPDYRWKFKVTTKPLDITTKV